MDITQGTSPSNTTISYQTSKSQLEAINLSPTTYVLPCRPAAFKHDDQQLRHRHRYDLRYGHDSPRLPSTDHSTKTTALFSTETAKQEL